MWECSGLTEEQYNQFRAQFLSLDQNKDGLITVEEVQQVMAGAGLVCRLEEINRMMETCDRNKVRLEKLNIAMNYATDLIDNIKININTKSFSTPEIFLVSLMSSPNSFRADLHEMQ